MKKTITIIVITSVIVGGGTFYGGMKYQQSKSPFGNMEKGFQFGDRTGTGNGAKIRSGGGFVSGEVISKENNSITVKTQNGGSSIVFLSSDTKVSKNADGSLDDVVVGVTVSSSGTSNQDGSFNAKTLQIRPAMPQIPSETK